MRRVALFVLLLLLAAGTAEATVRILPLGDSLTKGSTQTPEEAGHPTYRYRLWQQLEGRDVDFVGSWTAPNFAYDFDQDHEGHGGYMTGGILNGVAADPRQGKLSIWLQQYGFDVALVMLGTNDVLNNVSTEESVRNLEGIIGDLRHRNPEAVVLLAQIPPTSISRPKLNALNAAIPGIAFRTSTSRSPVVVVDQFTGYDGVADNQAPLGIHPDESGEQKIADRWYAALQPYLAGGATQSPTPTPSPTPSPTPTPATSPTPALTPGAPAPNVVRAPGAVVYTGERGLDVRAGGIGTGQTLGWFANGPGTNANPVATIRIDDPLRTAIPHDARTGAWYNLDRDRALALRVEHPAISLRLVDAGTGQFVTGGEVAAGRRFDLEVSGSLSAFADRGTGAPVAVRVRDPAGRIDATLVGDGGVPLNLDRLMVTTTPYRIRGVGGAAWNTGDPTYAVGRYEVWAEALLDHEHGTANPDPSVPAGRQVSSPVRLSVVAPAPPVTPATPAPVTTGATPSPATLPTTSPPTPLSTPTSASTTVETLTTVTTAPPVVTSIPPTAPGAGISWWFPYFLVALAVVLLVTGGGIWWALRGSGTSDEPRPVRPTQRAPPRPPGGRDCQPEVQIALDRIRSHDPFRGRVRSLEAALRGLEQSGLAQAGRDGTSLLDLIPPGSIPSRPMPEPVRRWGERVGFVPLSIDRYGDVLFYSPTPHQGGTHLVVKAADELLDRLGSDGNPRR